MDLDHLMANPPGLVTEMDLAYQIKQVKRELKDWERAFLDAEGRKPNKDDIAADRAVQKRYRLYAKLKRAEKNATEQPQWQRNEEGEDPYTDDQRPSAEAGISPDHEDDSNSHPYGPSGILELSRTSSSAQGNPRKESHNNSRNISRPEQDEYKRRYSEEQSDTEYREQAQDDDCGDSIRVTSQKRDDGDRSVAIKQSHTANSECMHNRQPFERDSEPARWSRKVSGRPGDLAHAAQESPSQEGSLAESLYGANGRPSFTSPPPPLNTEPPAPAPWRKRGSLSRLNSPACGDATPSVQPHSHGERSTNSQTGSSASSSRPTSPVPGHPILSPKSTSSPISHGTTPMVAAAAQKVDLPTHFKLKRSTIASGPISTAEIEAGLRLKSANPSFSNDASRPSSAGVETLVTPTRGVLLPGPVMGSEYKEFVNRRRQMEALAAQQYEKEREEERQREKEASITSKSPRNTVNSVGGTTAAPTVLAVKPISISVGPPPLPNERHFETPISSTTATTVASRDISAGFVGDKNPINSKPPPVQAVDAFTPTSSIPSSPTSLTMKDGNASLSLFVKAVKRSSIDQGGDIVSLDSSASPHSHADDEDVDVIVPITETSNAASRRDSMSPRANEAHSPTGNIGYKGIPIMNPKFFK